MKNKFVRQILCGSVLLSLILASTPIPVSASIIDDAELICDDETISTLVDDVDNEIINENTEMSTITDIDDTNVINETNEDNAYSNRLDDADTINETDKDNVYSSRQAEANHDIITNDQAGRTLKPIYNNDEEYYVISECNRIVSEVTTPDMSDLEKYWALAKWVTDNIAYAYNGEGVINDGYRHVPGYDTLKTRYDICMGFSFLYEKMCHCANLECLKNDTNDNYEKNHDGHQLNVIPNINGHSYYVDTTWNRFLMSDDTLFNDGMTYGESFEKWANCDDNTFEERFSTSDTYWPAPITDNMHNTYDKWFNHFALHQDDPYSGGLIIELPHFDTPYVEKGSGVAGTHYSQPYTDDDCPWYMIDYFGGKTTIDWLTNKKIVTSCLNIRGINESYSCDSVDELMTTLNSEISISVFPSIQNGKVELTDEPLTKNTDYKLSFDRYDANNEEAVITIKGIGDYSSSGTFTVTCSKPIKADNDITYATITGVKDTYYKSTAYSKIKNDIIVAINNNILTIDTDYELTEEQDSTDHGTYKTQKYHIRGKGNYIGEQSFTVKIIEGTDPDPNPNPKPDPVDPENPTKTIDISTSKTKVLGLKSFYTYTNDATLLSEINDTIDVRYNGQKVVNLTKDTDYTVSITGFDPYDDHTVVIKITGIGNYTGDLNKSVKVKYPGEKDTKSEYVSLVLNQTKTYPNFKGKAVENKNPSVANMDENGTIHANAAGDATIVVTTDDTVWTITVNVTEFDDKALDLVLIKGASVKNADFVKTKADGKNYKVTNTNKKIASVSDKGIVKANKIGTATITLEKADMTRTLNITVVEKPSMKFNKTLTYVGQTVDAHDFMKNYTDEAPVIKWTSSKPAVASIDASTGEVSVNKEGSTSITAFFTIKNQDDATSTVKISSNLTVKIPKFNKPAISMQTGQVLKLGMKNVNGANDPTFYIAETDGDTDTVTPLDEDDNRLTVRAETNKKGAKTGKAVLTALSSGQYILTAVIDEQEYTCTVNVTEPKIQKAKITVKVNKTGTVGLKNTKIKKNDIVWASEDEDIATVTTGGKVTGISPGTVIIYTETGGVRNECEVTVK